MEQFGGLLCRNQDLMRDVRREWGRGILGWLICHEKGLDLLSYRMGEPLKVSEGCVEEGLREKIRVETKDEAVAALQAGDRPKPG